MTQITFYNLGNADTSLIEVRDGRRILVDYADVKDRTNTFDKRCDLPKQLNDDLDGSNQKHYTVVAFTHLDNDHCKGAPDFFWFEHAQKYQDQARKKIETLWVPAAAITEEGLEDDARIIRQEARYRLKEGYGIRVFSRPERLQKWLEAEGLTVESRSHCFVDAGTLVPDFDLNVDGLEFFVHSPHASRTNDRGIEDRNGDSLVFQCRFAEADYLTDVLFTADIDHNTIAEIVDITKQHSNEERLHWNVYKLPHHCSYLSIGPEKGNDITEPVEQVAWLCEEQGEKFGYVVSSSKPIPIKNSSEDIDVQPPHRQAASYYQTRVIPRERLLVTMEEPSIHNPQPLVIEITPDGAIKKDKQSETRAAVGVVAPRAGFKDGQ